jgi:pimeloyl-ACP methyl ester carboxylesterase
MIDASDLRGASRLIIDAVTGVTGIVESMHRNISGLAPLVGPSPKGRTQGITGLVYGSVRGVSRVVGLGLDAALAKLAPLLKGRSSSPQREAVVAALNGVLGDYLAASGNPLAISMHLRPHGRPSTSRKVVVLVHGLCMNDLQWRRDGHDHGASLARDLGYAPLYLHYNSGLPIDSNGRELAGVLERLVRGWPVRLEELVVIGHSMGGLVARSALGHGKREGHAWPRRLKKLVFMGTPHLGAPLERAGHGVDILLGISPYTAPLSRLGKIRSAGVKDLRHGRFFDEGARVPLPRGVKCFAIAASLQRKPGGSFLPTRGDGLVPVKSALGQSCEGEGSLSIPASRQRICYGLGHLDLLGSREVYDQLRTWLGEP